MLFPNFPPGHSFTLKKRNVTKHIIHFLFLLWLSHTCLATQTTPQPDRVDPAGTKVLLLSPIVSTTPTNTNDLPRLQALVRMQMQVQLIGRNFSVMGEAIANRSAAQPPVVKLETLEERSAESFDTLGARSGADWVVSLTVHEVARETLSHENALDDSDLRYSTLRCKITIQCRDVRRKTWIANRTYYGRANIAGNVPDDLPYMIEDSVEKAATEALLSVLWPYPEVVPVARRGIVDYLGQATEAVKGEPGHLFTTPRQTPARRQ